MSYRKKITVIFIIFLVIIGIALIITELDVIHYNQFGYQANDIRDIFGQGMGLLSLSALPTLFLLLFTKEAVYKSWILFSLIFLPISITLIAITPEHCGSLFCLFTRENITFSLSGLFLFISLIIIIVQSIQTRGKK